MLEYTGHPIVDVGIATIVAFADKDRPDELTEADLEAVADYMAQNYVSPAMTSFLSIAFTINTGFTQPSYKKTPEKKEKYGQRVLRSFREQAPRLQELDPFFGLPVVDVSLDPDDKLPPGRAFRQHIPLQIGVDLINFYPYGESGLPVSGEALLAIQAYPLGSLKCGGRTLFVHSPNPEIMQFFARDFLQKNRLTITLLQQANSKKFPEPDVKMATAVIETLIKAIDRQRRQQKREEPFSITAYHLSNSGQGADLSIYHLPSQIISYLQLMLSPDYEAAWNHVVRYGWALPKLKRGQTEAPSDFQPDRNHLYEDLFRLAQDIAGRASQFIRVYFLRDTLRYARNDPTDPRGKYSLRRDAHLVSWKLAEPFLRRIMNMEAERVEQIRALGDALADYVKEDNDRRFFRNFYTVDRYDHLRNALIKANTAYVKRGNEPFLTFDTFIGVFESGENLARVDWRLARDLVLIRTVEQLHKNGWLGANVDAVPEITEEDNQS